MAFAIMVTSALFFSYLYRITSTETMNTLNKDLNQINQSLEKSIQTTVDIVNDLACDVELGNAVDKFYSDDLADSVQGKE